MDNCIERSFTFSCIVIDAVAAHDVHEGNSRDLRSMLTSGGHQGRMVVLTLKEKCGVI